MKKLIPLLLLPLLAQGAILINGGFESGDLTGWTFTGETENSFPSKVEKVDIAEAANWASNFGFFTPETMEGEYSFFSGFDGTIQEITLSQDIGTIDQFTKAVAFDVRAGWDLETYSPNSPDVMANGGIVEDREIKVVITDNITSEVLLSQNLFSAKGGEKVLDSGFQTVGIEFENIVGHDVTLSFVQNIPQAYTGPALIQLDNIRLQENYTVPEPSSFGLLTGLTLMFYLALRRR